MKCESLFPRIRKNISKCRILLSTLNVNADLFNGTKSTGAPVIVH